jgi:hypothetical protein
MNKQPTLQHHPKTRRRQIKLSDMPAKKDKKGGSALNSANGNSGIPTSLQEFLKRDSLPIKSN